MAVEDDKVVVPSFEDMMKDKTFKDTYQASLDSGIGKGVDAYKKGNYQTAVDEAAMKLANKREEDAKHKTPEQLQIEEMANTMKTLQSELSEERKTKAIATNKSTALKGLTDKGMPSGFIDFIVADTEEATLKNLDNISKVLTDHMQGIKTKQLEDNNTSVPGATSTSGGSVKEPGEGASKAEWKVYWAAKEAADKQQ